MLSGAAADQRRPDLRTTSPTCCRRRGSSREPTSGHSAAAGLAEPLTVREVEILRLVATGMRNQEIADHLFISLSTVKRHIANAYGKLGVSHRTEAVARANELNLLQVLDSSYVARPRPSGMRLPLLIPRPSLTLTSRIANYTP